MMVRFWRRRRNQPGVEIGGGTLDVDGSDAFVGVKLRDGSKLTIRGSSFVSSVDADPSAVVEVHDDAKIGERSDDAR